METDKKIRLEDMIAPVGSDHTLAHYLLEILRETDIRDEEDCVFVADVILEAVQSYGTDHIKEDREYLARYDLYIHNKDSGVERNKDYEPCYKVS